MLLQAVESAFGGNATLLPSSSSTELSSSSSTTYSITTPASCTTYKALASDAKCSSNSLTGGQQPKMHLELHLKPGAGTALVPAGSASRWLLEDLLEQLHHELATAGITYTAVIEPVKPDCAAAASLQLDQNLLGSTNSLSGTDRAGGTDSIGCGSTMSLGSTISADSFARTDSTDSIGSTSCSASTGGTGSCVIRLFDGCDACGGLPAVHLQMQSCEVDRTAAVNELVGPGCEVPLGYTAQQVGH
jgi:hypothetical protein